MSAEDWVAIGGVFHVAMAIFHLLFWRLLRWNEDLASLTSLNRAVMQILNLCLTAAFLVFAYLSLVHPLDMVTTSLGRALLGSIAVFWLFRAALQLVYLNLRSAVMLVLFASFLLGAAVHVMPLVLA